jgi:hypothetical protein
MSTVAQHNDLISMLQTLLLMVERYGATVAGLNRVILPQSSQTCLMLTASQSHCCYQLYEEIAPAAPLLDEMLDVSKVCTKGPLTCMDAFLFSCEGA